MTAVKPIPALSPRENQVCGLISEGKKNREIAVTLKLAESTVKEYIDRIFLKLHCHSRAEIAVCYVQGASAIKPARANHPTKTKPTPASRRSNEASKL